MKNNPNICVVTYPTVAASISPLTNLVDVLSELSETVYLITGNEGKNIFKKTKNIKGYSIDYKNKSFFIAKSYYHLLLQLKITKKILAVNKHIDAYVFFMSTGLMLPMLVCKITNKPIILSLASSLSEMMKNDKTFLTKIFIIMEKITYSLSNKIIIYSPKLISEWNLQKYSKKIYIANEHIIDFETFYCKKFFDDRKDIIGYIGRLSYEKGIMEFVQAISKIINKNNQINVIIGGDGPLKSDIVNYINEHKLNYNINVIGWISHEILPDYFNELKLLVLPSHTEGLPNVMLEAMACGTPVLVSPVGAITDIIKDGISGFILENNSPECIANDILRALYNPNLKQIALNGIKLIKEEYNREKAIKKYQMVLKII